MSCDLPLAGVEAAVQASLPARFGSAISAMSKPPLLASQ